MVSKCLFLFIQTTECSFYHGITLPSNVLFRTHLINLYMSQALLGNTYDLVKFNQYAASFAISLNENMSCQQTQTFWIVVYRGFRATKGYLHFGNFEKIGIKDFCCTVHIQIVRQYFWWYSTVEHLHQWALLLVGSWCSKDHFDTKTSF